MTFPLPRSSAFAYHATSVENLRPISEEGITTGSNRSGYLRGVEDCLQEVAASADVDPPVRRHESVFLYPRIEDVVHSSGYRVTSRHPEGVVVVDVEAIDHPMALADFPVATALIDCDSGRQMEATMTELALEYLDGLVRVVSVEDVCERSTDYELPELLVDGGVPPSAIVEIVFPAREIYSGDEAPPVEEESPALSVEDVDSYTCLRPSNRT